MYIWTPPSHDAVDYVCDCRFYSMHPKLWIYDLIVTLTSALLHVFPQLQFFLWLCIDLCVNSECTPVQFVKDIINVRCRITMATSLMKLLSEIFKDIMDDLWTRNLGATECHGISSTLIERKNQYKLIILIKKDQNDIWTIIWSSFHNYFRQVVL